MAIVPFRWQGTARAEQLRALVSVRTHEWSRNWCVGSPVVDLRVSKEDRPDSGRNSDRWFRVDAPCGTLSLRINGNAFEQLGSRLAGVVAPDSLGLAASAGMRAVRDLALSIAGAGDGFTALDTRPARQMLDARCGAIGLIWSLDSVQIELYLDAGLCDSMLPARAASVVPLSPRGQAIGAGEVKLQAVLDLGQAALADAHLLRPGEILKTNIPLDAPVAVRTENGATVFTGVLAGIEGHRAVRYTRIEKAKGNS